MSGNKTHQLQKDILAGRIETANADKDFDPRPDLRAQEAGRDPAQRAGQAPVRAADDDSDLILRGKDQESTHHKNSGRPADDKG